MSGERNNQKTATIKLLVEAEEADSKSEYHQPQPKSRETEQPDIKVSNHHSGKADILNRLLQANMLVHGSRLDATFQDQYRRIKRPLLSNAFGKSASLVEKGNLILVTSSVPGEGKTYTSINLALSIAQEKDNTVLLVDCDVAKQGVSRALGIEKRDGLVDVLESDHLTIGDVMLQTDLPNLRVLSAGKQDEYMAELLASQRMSDLVNEIATRYDDRVIIIDGPPILVTPQTQIMAGLVGQIVFVIEAGKTSQSLVEDALELIPEEKATGLVMNKNEGLSGQRGYNYDYYGHYGIEDGKKGR